MRKYIIIGVIAVIAAAILLTASKSGEGIIQKCTEGNEEKCGKCYCVLDGSKCKVIDMASVNNADLSLFEGKKVNYAGKMHIFSKIGCPRTMKMSQFEIPSQ